MNVLAFDTSTEALSIAVGRWQGGVLRLWEHEGPGGAQASATLVPQAMALLGQAGIALRGLDAIAFGAGPGSFTGLRTACAVAQGLAFGAGVPVLPVDTLLAVAEEARHQGGHTQIQVVLDARMDQVYTAAWRHDGVQWHAGADAVLAAPEHVPVRAGWVLAGNAFAAYGSRLPAAAARVPALPAAAALLRLAPQLLAAGAAVPAAQAMPRYIRDKVAQTTEERAAQRAAGRSPA